MLTRDITNIFRFIICSFTATIAISALSAQTSADSDRPSVSPSLLDVNGRGNETTPFFKKIDAAFNAAHDGDLKIYTQLLAPRAKAELIVWDGPTRRGVPLTVATIQAITKNCFGPYPIGEGTSWVQFSFVCSTDAASTLAPFIHFKNTPELAMTADFENGRITSLTGLEVILIPGRRMVTMTAYDEATTRR